VVFAVRGVNARVRRGKGPQGHQELPVSRPGGWATVGSTLPPERSYAALLVALRGNHCLTVNPWALPCTDHPSTTVQPTIGTRASLWVTGWSLNQSATGGAVSLLTWVLIHD